MADFRYVAGGLSFTLIILFGVISFYSSGVENYAVSSNLNVSGLKRYEEFNNLIETSKSDVSADDSVNVDAGQIIWSGAITFLQGILSGAWLSLITNLFMDAALLMDVSATQLAIFIGFVFITIIMLVISIFMGRDV
jgi:hypothetical protein